MNPYLGRSGPIQYTAYDGLTYLNSKGQIVPNLATTWAYSGKARQYFTITLRKGVRLSDGSRLTAQLLKQDLLYFQAVKGNNVALASYDSVTVTGPLTVRLHLTGPSPLLPLAMSQRFDLGAPLCASFLANPDLATSETCGAGPYVLDTANTIPGNLYVLNANPYYWNKSAVHYKRMVFKIIANPNSILAALKTGEIDTAVGDGTTVGAALQAGFRVSGAPAVMWAISIQDATGKLVPALGDVRVRQALNYAIDRKAVTKVLYPIGGVAFPINQPFLPAEEFWNKGPYSNKYPYNPAKAKQLLAAAGYPNGFSFTVNSSPVDGIDNVGLAIANYWDKIGVHITLDSDASLSDYSLKETTGAYPAYVMEYGSHPADIIWGAVMSPNAGSGRNAFHLSDPQLNSLVERAENASQKEAAQLWQQAGRRIIDLAWFVPVTMSDQIIYARSNVAGVLATPERPVMDYRDVYPSGK